MASWSGNGVKTTEQFDVGDEWIVNWANLEGGDFSLFQIYAYEPGEDTFGMPKIVANTMTEGSDVSYVHKAGRFYLEINSVGAWAISVETR